MTVLSSNEETKARKDHNCDFCGGKINIGSKYLKSTIVYDDIYDWKTHVECEWIAQELDMYKQCEYDEGLTSNDFNEIIREEFYTLMSDMVPKESDYRVFWAFKNVVWREQLGHVIRHHKKLKQ